MHRVDAMRAELLVRDDGVGFPIGRDYRQMQSLGMSLVAALADQMSGEISITNSAGTACKITFAT